MSPNVLGLDLALAHAGAAQLHQDGRVYTWHSDTDPLPADASIATTARRIRSQARWSVGRATVATELVVIEELPRGTQNGQHDERAALVWAVATQFVMQGVPVAFINPTSLKHKIAGNGRASKEEVQFAVVKLYPGQGLARASKDETDAAGLATLGVLKLAQHLGPDSGWKGPWLDARAISLDSGCRWPDLGPGWVKPKPAPLRPVFAVPS